MQLWNQKELEPCWSTVKATGRNFDILEATGVLQQAINDLTTNQTTLEVEAAMLSRCMYRMKSKFCKYRGFKAMQKTNRAVKQYQYVNIIHLLEQFQNSIPRQYEIDTYLPSRNVLDCILLRLQGISKLCVRTAEVAQECSIFMESKVEIGQFWKVAIIIHAICSRICTLVKNIAEICCRLYTYFVKQRLCLENTSENLLPQNYEYLHNIGQWSGFDETFSKNIHRYKVLNTEEIDLQISIKMEEAFDVTTEESQPKQNIFKNEEDIGEVIQQDNLRKQNINKNKHKKHKQKQQTEYNTSGLDRNTHIIKKEKNILENLSKSDDGFNSYKDLKTIEDIQQFIIKEDQLRAQGANESLSKILSNEKWSKLKKCVKKSLTKNDEKTVKKVRIVLQKMLSR